MKSFEEAYQWYSENAHRIKRFEYEEEDGTHRPLTNTEMYWLTQIKQAEDDGVDVPTDPQFQLEQALLKNAELTQQLAAADESSRMLASTMDERLTAAEARVGRLRDGFKLCIGMNRDVPWMNVPDSDVDGYVERAEQLKAEAAKGWRE